MGGLDEAAVSYRQAIKLKPDYTEAHNNLGNTLMGLRRLLEAEASYRKAIEIKSDLVEAYWNLDPYFELDRFDEADTSFRQTLELQPTHSSAKHMLAAVSGKTTQSAP